MPLPRSALDRSWPFAVLALAWLAVLGAILALDGGSFTYTLDDAYIHLAFSEQLAQGHFGLVAGEAASPSSSILFPLLLVPLSGTAWHQFQPLLWDLLALIASLALWRHLFARHVLAQPRPALAGLLALLAVALLNQIGLAFSGMEASLQIACSLAVAVGMVELAGGGRLRWWLVAGIVLGPLLRYESLSVSLPALLLLATWGRWRMAALCLGAIVLTLGGYALYCSSIGLAPVPGSLLVKTGFDGANLAGGLWDTVKFLGYSLLQGRTDLPVLLLIALLVVNLLDGRRARRERGLIAVALVAVLAQFAFGGHGSLGRYDVHAWSFGLAVAAYANRGAAQRLVQLGGGWIAIGWAALLVGLFPYAVYAALATPLAAGNIYLQQYQMHRLLVEFVQAKALVNDAGLTAYRNPYGIVDMLGLGSETIRRLRRDGENGETISALSHEARLAVIYAGWLSVPPSWQKLAVLRLDRRRVSVAEREVTIFALRAQDAPALKAALQRFAGTLPGGASLIWLPGQ